MAVMIDSWTGAPGVVSKEFVVELVVRNQESMPNLS